ncbi:MAG: tetratricopeptide repeat protein [candidate division WOR-3 bacterium]|nr:MAG: tetratricopeptide repeat protein [candidate division WOR-3 bacterium]
MKLDRIASVVLLTVALLTHAHAAENREFSHALDAYRGGDYAIARIYFENLLDDDENREFFGDAVYYLLKIHIQEGDFISFLFSASRFLEKYNYDSRSEEVFAITLRELVGRNACLVAYEYVRKYDFLVSDLLTLEEMGRCLLGQGESVKADYILSFCDQSDTVKVLRAMSKSDLDERVRTLESLKGPTRDLYLIDNLLLVGDTVSAYVNFRNMTGERLEGSAFYRYMKIALLFDRSNLPRQIKRLGAMKGFERKADLVYALAAMQAPPQLLPQDDEEKSLFVEIVGIDTVSRAPPQDIPADSILQYAEDTLLRIRQLRGRFKANYFLDSLYCQYLIARGDYGGAGKVISGYLEYANTEPYARKLIGFDRFAKGDYETAARHAILSRYRSPAVTYVLAECLRMIGQGVAELYDEVADQTSDSLLRKKAIRGYVLESYSTGDYDGVLMVDIGDLAGDTALIRLYARSLASSGKVDRADSLYNLYFQEADEELLNLYGEYLIGIKKYNQAKAYYDSLIHHSTTISNGGVYYNWAMTSFMSNEVDSALHRFRYYVANFPQGGNYHESLFKIATLHYLMEEYDSAGYYYGLACEDDALMRDAIQNQLISYKKAGNWALVISTGEKILSLASDEEKADAHFEIGYAYLRAGRVHEAVENLRFAARAKKEPSYYYWLGEAYLGKGDFSRAFHSYQKIVDIFSDDEMWAPTARYKSGIALELLDELDAARKVYERLIRERGIRDPIAAEANLRLERLAQ